METPYSDDKHDLTIEKGSAPLLPSNNDNVAEKPKSAYTSKMHLIVLSGILLYFVTGFGTDVARRLSSSTQTHVSCPTQPKPLGSGDVWQVPENYSDVAAGRLSRAVQIPAVSYDNMGAIGEDTRWDAHYNFDEFLAKEYPQVYSHLKHEAVNTHGHLYTWAGSGSSLQPIVLMAHQDVVPVNPSTLNQWTHNPFDGVIQDGWVWGRGAADCKNQLMGIMSALDKLIQDEYKPERTILVAFGFDEEIGGVQGAAQLSAVIQERYGKNSVAFLVDEGFGGVDEAYGATFASLGMAEKGYVNMDITIETPGGHSSVPPEHTGIGLLSQAINQLEAHPYTPHLTASSPYLKYLTCLADYSPKLPGSLRKMIKDPKKWGKLARELSKDVKERAFLGTTQAVDLISGGVKVNALPEEAKATVNYRIDFTSSVAETKARISKLLLPIAHKHQLTYVAFNKTQPTCPHQRNKSGTKGKMTLSIGSEAPDGLEPAPITSDKGESFKLMGGTIRGVFGKEVIVAPSAMFANTDTRHFWDVTENLYRFIPASVAEFKNPHTVDERVSVRAHVTTIRFFYELIINMEGWRQGDEKA